MTGNISVTVMTADLTELANKLAESGKKADATVGSVLDEVSGEIAEKMRQLAPKRTGRLANSIQVVKGRGTWTIGPVGVNYAIYQEYGTASRGEFGGSPYKIKPKDPNGSLHFKIDGKWISTKEVTHPGIPAHPYIRPAAKQVIDSVGSRVGVEVVKKMRGR